MIGKMGHDLTSENLNLSKSLSNFRFASERAAKRRKPKSSLGQVFNFQLSRYWQFLACHEKKPNPDFDPLTLPLVAK
jgi:hypothetical protein